MSGEYDPEATVEFEPIERPLSEVEEEIARTVGPDQRIIEGLALPIENIVTISHQKIIGVKILGWGYNNIRTMI